MVSSNSVWSSSPAIVVASEVVHSFYGSTAVCKVNQGQEKGGELCLGEWGWSPPFWLHALECIQVALMKINICEIGLETNIVRGTLSQIGLMLVE